MIGWVALIKMAKIWCDEFWKATTDPGISYLGINIGPMLNEEGTAILDPSQYLNVYKIAKHRKNSSNGHALPKRKS